MKLIKTTKKDMDIISAKLKNNYINDLKRLEIDPKERAQIIQDIMIRQDISQREFARRFGFPHSTIQDWLLWNRVTEEDIEQMREKGLTHTDIYRTLREDRNHTGVVIAEKVLKFDIETKNYINLIKENIRLLEKSTETIYLLQELRNYLSKLMFKLSQVHKPPR